MIFRDLVLSGVRHFFYQLPTLLIGLSLMGYTANAVLAATNQPKGAAPSKWEWSVGAYMAEIESRSDADKKTEISAVPLTLKWRSGLRWAKASVSWVSIAGPGNVESDLSEHLALTEVADSDGLGDLFLSTGRYFQTQMRDRTVWLELSGKAKIPLTDYAKRLSTGEPDLSVTGAIYYPLSSDLPFNLKHLYGKLSYLWRKDPREIDLENRPSMIVGFTAKAKSNWSWGAQWDWRGQSIDNTEAKQLALMFATKKWYQKKRVKKFTPFVMFDVTDPDQEMGLGFTITQ